MSNTTDSARVIIFDTTLRDGEQSPGASMNLDEKLRIAQVLEELGVDVIEAGFPIASTGDFEAVREIAKIITETSVAGLARAGSKDIDRAWEALKHAVRPRIHTFISTSPLHMKYKLQMEPEAVHEAVIDSVGYARNLCDDVEWSPEDGARTEHDFLCRCVESAIKAGARTINIPDTVGYAVPEEFAALIEMVINRVPNIDQAVISVHCHNDLGLAVANSLAAVIKTEYSARVARLVSTITGFVVQPNKAIVGANAFAHEAGIHQDGVLKHAETYEIMTPETVGLTKSILVMGKHSGRHAFKEKLKELGFELDDAAAEDVFRRFKNLADKKKEIFDEDIVTLVDDEVVRANDRIRIVSLKIICGTEAPQTAELVLEVDGEVRRTTATGDGPVDATFKAIAELFPHDANLQFYQVHAVTQGSDAQAEVTVRLEEGGKTVNGQGADTDTMVASARAYIHALNKLLIKREKTAPTALSA